MAYVFDGRKVAPEDSGDKDTLKGRMSQIKINKDMTSERNMMDFLLENEEDLEDSTPTPQRQQQCCNAPNIVQMDEHTEQCQNCGAQSMKPRFENQAEESERPPAAADQPVTKGWYAQSWQDLAMAMQGKIDVLEEKVRSYHTTDRSKRALANEDIVESSRDAIEALEMKINYHG
ncbi:unnamed protein product [Mytilus coruscus]|uniref:Uncharacterized protein n=1 Tax=Mytilus coruscus TaxID=42192 RepID=A0A6J8BFK7_MYTCO|nr:unnamed protein product [Mytilus coruscus]